MNPTTNQRLAALRGWMREEEIDIYIVPTADPHGSEYIAPHWQVREWLTGFTGSAGTAVVTQGNALLWTDSRYWLQAAEQLGGTAFRLMRDGAEDVPSLMDWVRTTVRDIALDKEGKPACTVGFCAETLPWDDYRQLEAMDYAEIADVFCTPDPFSKLWADRPAPPDAPVELHPEALAGLSAEEKMRCVWETVKEQYPDKRFEHILLSDLSEIAWTLNLRGADIEFNPVFYAYLALHENHFDDGYGTLYTNTRRVPREVVKRLQEAKVYIEPYEAARLAIHPDGAEGDHWMVAEGANTLIAAGAEESYNSVASDDFTVYPSPAAELRSQKNYVEQEGFRRAMERDGVAMVQLLRWMEEELPESELAVSRKLYELRSQQEGFCGLSFETISAYAAHGAIVHYEPTPETDAPLAPKSFLLLDSGAQYDCGTTDITRTIPLGPLTNKERLVYTLVLKGHIALSTTRFPEGTTGLQLDLAARRAMWKAGYDYGHGTGHGVGSRLCVHEGPHQIRKNPRPCTLVPFRPGMTVTDEPGIYVEGRFGVRIENVLLCTYDGETPFGHFCRFEPLTLCPIDLRPVLWERITSEERHWLNAYHAEVRRRLLPLLDDEADREWLIQKTADA